MCNTQVELAARGKTTFFGTEWDNSKSCMQYSRGHERDHCHTETILTFYLSSKPHHSIKPTAESLAAVMWTGQGGINSRRKIYLVRLANEDLI